MVSIQRASNSCGILEVSGVSFSKFEPRQFLAELKMEMDTEKSKTLYMTFSDDLERPNLYKLRDFMVDNGFKKLYQMPEGINPNSKNTIGFLIWVYDEEKLNTVYQSWIKEHPEEYYEVIGNSCRHDLKIGQKIRKLIYRNNESFYYKSSWYINLSDVKKL